jgi:hypothetical protein
MIIGTIFTLFVVPAIYTVVAKTWEPDPNADPKSGWGEPSAAPA